MTTTIPSVPFVDGFVFLEGPRWYEKRLWVSDIFANTVFAIDESGSREAIIEVPGRPSGLGFLPDGIPLVVAMQDRAVYKFIDGALCAHANLSTLVDSDINDMVVDGNGRAYVGSMGYDLFAGEESRTGEICAIETDGSARVVARDLDFPNGLVVSADGKTLFVAESFGARVSRFTIDSNGDIGEKSLFAELPGLVPDGMCLDQSGNIWVAGAMGGEFVQVSPRGEIIARVDVRPHAAIACQLGGADGRNLYCLVYEGGIEEISSGHAGARIEVARVKSPAAGSP